MQIAPNTVVSIAYTLTDGEGEVLDTSRGQEPLAYVHGVGAIIPGLENALTGHSVGDAFTVTIPPEEAYGERDPDLLHVARREQFQGVAEVELGMQFQASSPSGQRVVTVVAIEHDRITLDANHPLAGVTLHFDVEVMEVRPATAEELEHKHVHGAGGAHG